MKDLHDICLTDEALASAEFDDTKAISEEYEREWFMRNKRVGYKWSPIRKEMLDIWRGNSDEHYRMQQHIRWLSWATLAEGIAIVVLAFLMLR